VVTAGLAGVVLAAGAGTRLRPLTLERPKALCPVGNVPLVDWALRRLVPWCGEGPGAVAVNVHESAPTLLAHVQGRAFASVEAVERLGTAGALGRLRAWIDGRHVLVHNADSFVDDDLAVLVEGWDGVRARLLVRTEAGPSDFGDRRFLGVSLLPAAIAATLPDVPCGLYGLVWRPAYDAGELELVEARGTSIDCGTPADYLAANLHVSGGASLVADDAVVEGSITRCVVWSGARVKADEVLVDAIRTPLTTVDGARDR
jgi:mannose-1-phosphate guanylyltransferase/MurNAc alpha-1-phosphate uridylyltransferase